MKKKNMIATNVDKKWTVLLVDGKGRVRRIHNFRRKLWMLIGFSTVSFLLAAAMGVFYGGMLQDRIALEDEIDALEDRIVEVRQQNELLKARAVRLEAQTVVPGSAAAPAKEDVKIPTQNKEPEPVASVEQASPAPADPEPIAAPAPQESKVATAAEEQEEEKKIEVDAENLKVAYRAESATIEAKFIIKNTGQGPAGGRAVVVLHAEDGQSPLRFALPSVPLREGRPAGNRGRRFSISRFMTMTMERRFAEPGTRFVRAVVYAFTMEGHPLLDKPFDVDLDIPEKQKPAENNVESTNDSDNALPTVAPLGLELPKPETEQPTGVVP